MIRTPANPLLLCDGFRPDFIKPCLMHCVHLGALQLHNGSIITLLDEAGFLALSGLRYTYTIRPSNLNLEGWFGDVNGLNNKLIILCGRFKFWASANQIRHLSYYPTLLTLYICNKASSCIFSTMPCPAKAFAGHDECWLDEL